MQMTGRIYVDRVDHDPDVEVAAMPTAMIGDPDLLDHRFVLSKLRERPANGQHADLFLRDGHAAPPGGTAPAPITHRHRLFNATAPTAPAVPPGGVQPAPCGVASAAGQCS